MIAYFVSLAVCCVFACPWITCFLFYVCAKDGKTRKRLRAMASSVVESEETVKVEEDKGGKAGSKRRGNWIQDRVPPLFDEVFEPVIPSAATSRSGSSQSSRGDPQPPQEPEVRFVLASRLSLTGPANMSIKGRRLADHPAPAKIRYAIGTTGTTLAGNDDGKLVLASRIRRPAARAPDWGLYDADNDKLQPAQPLGPQLIRTRFPPPAPPPPRPQLRILGPGGRELDATRGGGKFTVQLPEPHRPAPRPLPGRLADLQRHTPPRCERDGA